MNPLPRSDAQSQVIALTGRLTTQPLTRTTQPLTRSTQSGSTVTSLQVVIPRPLKDGADQGPDVVDVTVVGPQGDSCATYLAKGRRIAVDGQLHHSEWDSDTGRRQKLEVIARNVEFLDRATDHTEQVPEVADAA
jgi:single-strand DNA-binding protein